MSRAIVRAALLSVVFPAGCRICEQLLTEPTQIPIRNDCLGSFRRRPVERIAISAAATFIFSRCVIEDCDGYAFDRVRSWAVYDGALVRAILLLKFENIDCSRDGWRKL